MADPLSIATGLLKTLQPFLLGSLAWSMKDEMVKLDSTLKTVVAVYNDAQKVQIQSESFQAWQEELMEGLCKAQNILHRSDCIELRKLVAQSGGKGDQLRHFFSKFNPIEVHYDLGKSIKEVTEKLNETLAKRNMLNVDQLTSSAAICRETDSHVNITEVLGRDCGRDKLINQLMRKDERLFIASIVGMGGLGKTVIAKLLYNDTTIETHFAKRIWVSLSKDFELEDTLHKILKSVSPDCNRDLSFNELKKNLRDCLKNKRFLIVLDDLWCESGLQLAELTELLSVGVRGSSLILTTRSTIASSRAGAHYTHNLSGLPLDSSMNLFMKKVRVMNPQPEVQEIMSKLVQKCGGIPLVINALGGLLRSNTSLGFWNSISEKNMVNMLQSEGQILPLIK